MKDSFIFFMMLQFLLNRDCTLEEDVVIGRNSSIGTGTFITKTVIGVNCKIGERFNFLCFSSGPFRFDIIRFYLQ